MKEVKKNFNHLLKSGKVYPIMIYPESYILINRRKYSFDLEKHNLSLDLNGDTVVIARVKDEILILPTITTSPDRSYGIIDNLQPYRTLSVLDRTRLDTINGKCISNAVLILLSNKIESKLKRLYSASAYNNGNLTKNFIDLNPELLDIAIINNKLNNLTAINLRAMSSNTDAYLLELGYYITVRYLLTFLGGLNKKYNVNTRLTIPATYEPEVKTIVGLYEKIYKEVKKLAKVRVLIENVRKDKAETLKLYTGDDAMKIANEKIFKIIDETLFQKELEWLEALQKAEGWVNESIISFCDRHRLSYGPDVTPELLESIVNYLTKIFGDFSLVLDTEDCIEIKKYFSEVKKPNYYSIKEFIVTEITKVKDKYDLRIDK